MLRRSGASGGSPRKMSGNYDLAGLLGCISIFAICILLWVLIILAAYEVIAWLL